MIVLLNKASIVIPSFQIYDWVRATYWPTPSGFGGVGICFEVIENRRSPVGNVLNFYLFEDSEKHVISCAIRFDSEPTFQRARDKSRNRSIEILALLSSRS